MIYFARVKWERWVFMGIGYYERVAPHASLRQVIDKFLWLGSIVSIKLNEIEEVMFPYKIMDVLFFWTFLSTFIVLNFTI